MFDISSSAQSLDLILIDLDAGGH